MFIRRNLTTRSMLRKIFPITVEQTVMLFVLFSVVAFESDSGVTSNTIQAEDSVSRVIRSQIINTQ